MTWHQRRREDEQAIAEGAGPGLVESLRVVDGDAQLRQEGRALGEALEHHGDPLGRQDVRLAAQDIGEGRGDVAAAVDAVAELVQQRGGPVVVRLDVGQDADVAFAVDVGAEGVRALPPGLVEVALEDDAVDGQADAGVELPAHLQDVGAGEGGVEVGVEDAGGLLEERVVVVPGHQLLDLDAVGFCQALVEVGLGGFEGPGGQGVQLVEQGQQLDAVLLVEVELQGVVVREAQLDGGLVAVLDQVLQVGFQKGSDLLAGLPGFLPLGGVLGVLEDLQDVVVGHFPTEIRPSGGIR